MRILRAVKADKTNSDSRQPVNLTLSTEAIRKGRSLEKKLGRPSLSNVVEFLIVEKAREMGRAKAISIPKSEEVAA